MKSFTINNISFRSRRATEDYIRSIIDKYDNNIALTGDDLAFVMELLSMHEDSTEKIGCGIKEIFITHENQYGGRNRHFNVKRTDGTTIDFSWNKCLDGN